MANQKIQKIKVSNSEYDLFVKKDWQENDPSSVSYIENRTHYIEKQYTPVTRTESLNVGASYRITLVYTADSESYNTVVREAVASSTPPEGVEAGTDAGIWAGTYDLYIMEDGHSDAGWIGAADYPNASQITVERITEVIVPLDAKYIPIDNDTIKVDADGKITVDELKEELQQAIASKLDKTPDGAVDLLDENQKINPHYLSDAIVGQLKFGGVLTGGTFTESELSSLLVGYILKSGAYWPQSYYIDIKADGTPSILFMESDPLDIPEGFYFLTSIYYDNPEEVEDTSTALIHGFECQNGDWLVVSNSKFVKIDNTDAVKTVNGKIGNVEITADELISAGSNITFTQDSGKTKISAKDTTYTADSTSILTLDGTTFSTDIVKKGSGENSLTIGTADIPSEFKSLAGSFTAEAPAATAEASIAAGTSSKAKSTGAMAFGVANQAGITGYYWNSISTSGTTTTITLSTSRSSNNRPSSTDWEIGDLVSVVNENKYPLCGTIATKPNAYTITIENCPFTESNYNILESLALAPDDKTIFAVKRTYNTSTQRSTLTPRTGAVQLGWAATVFGAMNIGVGTFSQTFGWQNITAGDFGLTSGRDNTTGYASATFGWNNENAGKQSIIAGKDNKLKRNCANAAGFGTDHVLENDAVFAAGSTHTIKAYAGAAIGSSNLVNAYASAAIGLALETNKQGQVVVGQYNKASTMNANGTAQFVVGTGSSRDATANGLILYKDGRLEVGADPTNSKDVVTLNYFNNNIGTATNTELTTIKTDVDALETFKDNLSSALIPVYTANAAATTGYNSVVIGETTDHTVSREYNLSVGAANTISTPYNLVSGKGHAIAGSAGFNLVSGINNIVASTGGYGATIGYNTRTGGTYSIAANYKTNARYKATSAFGVGTVTNNTIGQFVVGRANVHYVSGGDVDVRDALFVVGNGKDDEGNDINFNTDPVINSIDNVSNTYRSNAFMVMKDGRAKVGAAPVNDMDVATKQYVDSHSSSVDLSRVDQDVNIVNGHNLTVDGSVKINGDLEFNGDIAFGNIRSSVVNADEMYVAGKKVLVEGEASSGSSLPDCTGYQDGAVLVVRNGQWVIENPPTVIYTGEVE